MCVGNFLDYVNILIFLIKNLYIGINISLTKK